MGWHGNGLILAMDITIELKALYLKKTKSVTLIEDGS